MIAELHRCLVLGESPTSMFNCSIQGASCEEKSQVVSQDNCCVARRSGNPDSICPLLTPAAQLVASANRLAKYPHDLKTALEHRPGSVNPAWATAPVLCQCPKMGRVIKQRIRLMGPVRYYSSSKARHCSDCPLYSESDCQTTRSLAFPVLPFLAGTVELFSSFYSKQQLSHFLFSHRTPHRLVGLYPFQGYLCVGWGGNGVSLPVLSRVLGPQVWIMLYPGPHLAILSTDRPAPCSDAAVARQVEHIIPV
jgi:hypothetical protein